METVSNLPWWAPWAAAVVAGVLVLAVVMHSARKAAASPRTVSYLVGAQLVALAALVGAFLALDALAPTGLRSQHLWWGVAFYAVLFLGGTCVAWKQRRWIAVGLQLAVPCGAAVLFVSGLMNVGPLAS